jgi:hypothetical protein
MHATTTSTIGPTTVLSIFRALVPANFAANSMAALPFLNRRV